MTVANAISVASGDHVIDARMLTTSQLNLSLRTAVASGKRNVTILNPDARNSLGVGLIRPCNITFSGSVGYYCCAFCDGINATIEGNSGWGLGSNLMSGRIIVRKDAGASVGASMRGGEILVCGTAGARAGILMKGGTLVIAGDSGFMTGFMMQKGRIIVLGNVGHAAGDSLYEGLLYVGGKIGSLGADAKIEGTTPKEDAQVKYRVKALKIDAVLPHKFQKIVSAKKLYHYDSLEPLERERLVI